MSRKKGCSVVPINFCLFVIVYCHISLRLKRKNISEGSGRRPLLVGGQGPGSPDPLNPALFLGQMLFFSRLHLWNLSILLLYLKDVTHLFDSYCVTYQVNASDVITNVDAEYCRLSDCATSTTTCMCSSFQLLLRPQWVCLSLKCT
jgi:hypothetical protein